MDDAEMCTKQAAQEIELGGKRWDAEQAGLVERVARVIAEYPDAADWKRANAGQRERYERSAQRVIAMVVTECIPAAEAQRGLQKPVPMPGERSSAEYTPEEITIARAVDKLRVDADGLGWVRGMEPKATHDETGPSELDRLKRALVSLAYAALSAVDSSGTLTMDPNHRESVSLALKGLIQGAARAEASSVTESGTESEAQWHDRLVSDGD